MNTFIKIILTSLFCSSFNIISFCPFYWLSPLTGQGNILPISSNKTNFFNPTSIFSSMTMSQQNTSKKLSTFQLLQSTVSSTCQEDWCSPLPHWNYFCFSQEHPWFNFCQWPFCYLSVEQHVGRLAASSFWNESLHRFPGHHRHLLSSSLTGCASLSFCSSSSSPDPSGSGSCPLLFPV